MSEPTTELSKEDLIKTQQLVAEHTLKSDKGFTVLDNLYATCARQFMATQAFTFPVLSNLETIKAKLNDPAAFEKSFSTLLRDLKSMQELLMKTHAQHKGRTGKPDVSEWPIMFDASLNYNNIFHTYDTVINPLMMDLIGILEVEYPEMVNTTTA